MSWQMDLPDVARVHTFEVTDSTNLQAKRLAAGGAEHLTLVLANSQTAGRGRLDRRWISHEGNVYWSMIIRPAAHWPALGTLPFVSALSVTAALGRITGDPARFSIKWPNDVLLDRKKACGILHESAGPVREGLMPWVVVGIGINVVSHPTDAPLYPTASLHGAGFPEASKDIVIAELTSAFIGTLARWILGGYDAIKDELLGSMAGFGEGIVVRRGLGPADHLTGIFNSLDDEGRLLLTTDAGEVKRVVVGDIFLS